MNEHHQPFEEIKLINANGAEQWSARQLGKLLGYSEYRHFIPVLTRAKEACENSGHTIDDHFEEILDMVKIGSNAKRALKDIVLSIAAEILAALDGTLDDFIVARETEGQALKALISFISSKG